MLPPGAAYISTAHLANEARYADPRRSGPAYNSALQHASLADGFWFSVRWSRAAEVGARSAASSTHWPTPGREQSAARGNFRRAEHARDLTAVPAALPPPRWPRKPRQERASVRRGHRKSLVGEAGGMVAEICHQDTAQWASRRRSIALLHPEAMVWREDSSTRHYGRRASEQNSLRCDGGHCGRAVDK